MLVRIKGHLMLFSAAFIWGTTFVAQMTGMDGMGPFSYAAFRYALAIFSLLVIWLCFSGQRRKAKAEGRYHTGVYIGFFAGLLLFIASSLQQVAMVYTTAGKAAFITCLYIVFVPLLGIFLKKRTRVENWIGVMLAMTGLYFLAIKGDFSLEFGDALVLLSAIFWAIHILFIDNYANKADVIEISAVQIAICAVLSAVVAILFETPTLEAAKDAWFAIFYGGVMSAGIAFTLQIFGQKYVEPAHASIIMSFEAVFGAVSSWVILGEAMTEKEIFGCILMFLGVLVTQGGRRLFASFSKV